MDKEHSKGRFTVKQDKKRKVVRPKGYTQQNH